MRVLDKQNREIPESDIDLSRGCLVPETIIRDGAEPVDHANKHAWADEDYETIQRFIPFEDLPLAPGVPSTEEVTLDLLADHEYRLCILELTSGEVMA